MPADSGKLAGLGKTFAAQSTHYAERPHRTLIEFRDRTAEKIYR